MGHLFVKKPQFSNRTGIAIFSLQYVRSLLSVGIAGFSLCLFLRGNFLCDLVFVLVSNFPESFVFPAGTEQLPPVYWQFINIPTKAGSLTRHIPVKKPQFLALHGNGMRKKRT